MNVAYFVRRRYLAVVRVFSFFSSLLSFVAVLAFALSTALDGLGGFLVVLLF